ncbi:MAG: hypothetical protein M3N50_03590 [Pseudomonadota bacterium]|nr:hypothetical protein [Pseudomonadota bacterium]
MKNLSAEDMLETAAYALIGQRWRDSYLHDLRGALQALHSAIELLVRTAKTPGDNTALAEKASALARRTVAGYENSLVDLLDQLVPTVEVPARVNVGDLLGGILRFIRNEAAKKSITFALAARSDVFALTQAGKCRLLLLGLSAAMIDGLETGAIVDVTVGLRGTHAVIELQSAMPIVDVIDADTLWRARASTYEILLWVTHRWAHANGGGFEVLATAESKSILRIYYPIDASMNS